ncbi:MAG: DJ-1/PfpI/YhbO family deglycase/protease [Candidatus Omnitrophota bacterium]
MENRKWGMRFEVIGIVVAGLIVFGSYVLHAEEYVPSDLKGKNVAVLVGEGFQDAETLFPIGFLVNRGSEVTTIGVEKGYVKAYNSDTWVRVEMSAAEADADDYDAIVIPGGSSPAYLREHDSVVNFLKKGAQGGKVIAAICHGPQLLITAGMLEGKNVTSYPSVAEELYTAGANYDDVPVMRDGKIITSRVPDDLPHFVRAIETALSESE